MQRQTMGHPWQALLWYLGSLVIPIHLVQKQWPLQLGSAPQPSLEVDIMTAGGLCAAGRRPVPREQPQPRHAGARDGGAAPVLPQRPARQLRGPVRPVAELCRGVRPASLSQPAMERLCAGPLLCIEWLSHLLIQGSVRSWRCRMCMGGCPDLLDMHACMHAIL